MALTTIDGLNIKSDGLLALFRFHQHCQFDFALSLCGVMPLQQLLPKSMHCVKKRRKI